MESPREPSDPRPPERLRVHYEIEKALAARLRAASKPERRHLYTSLYDELFRQVPDHPMLGNEAVEESRRDVERQLAFLRRFLTPSTTFLEIGPGACALAFAVAARVRHVYGVEVSSELARRREAPENFTFVDTDGSSIDLPDQSVDLAYSHQLMEHLHPDDAADQLRHVHRVLVPGGRYVCITPNRLSGPWDVSRHFDRVASGFHLREYTVSELQALLRAAGFRRAFAYVGGRSRFAPFPTALLRGLERLLQRLPDAWGWRISHAVPVQLLLGMRLVAVK